MAVRLIQAADSKLAGARRLGAGALALTRTTQAQSYSRPTYSSPIAISLNDRLIWSVNPSDNSVSVIRPDNNTRLAKIAVGRSGRASSALPCSRPD